MADLFLLRLDVGPMQNFSYLVGSDKTCEVFIVDPGWEPNRLLKEAETRGLTVRGILLTHHHYDHTDGVPVILKKISVPVYIHEADASLLTFKSEQIQSVAEGQTLSIGGLEVKCLHTPGHSAGGLCFLIEGHLFTGDTLFIDACGRTDLIGGNARQMAQSLKRISGLDETIRVCPGHDYGSTPDATIGEQKKTNFYLRSK